MRIRADQDKNHVSFFVLIRANPLNPRHPWPIVGSPAT
jgi:hypothetical protein